ncbi:MAG: hypothetical protein U5R46_02115 [Gammaproteobacteria bacterium]|nr:hypothetical protein [Gammaproteobacteria bacterium]
MIPILRQVANLMLSLGILSLTTDTFNTNIALHSGLEDFPATVTELITTGCYEGGIVAPLYCTALINRMWCHIRAFSAFAALCAAVVVLHPFLVSLRRSGSACA